MTTDLLSLDATAVMLIGHDIAALDDAELDLPTPCTGWTIADLIAHMNERHAAVIAATGTPVPTPAGDPRDAFAVIAAHWVTAMEQTGAIVTLPRAGTLPTEQVLSIHFVDMLVHRWDIARALGISPETPARLTEIALPIARSITAPGSPLNGPNGVYHPSLAENPTRPAMDNIAALLGRDPHHTPSR
ncbi:TIGR03086 family metal-binding protein [Nocardia cyriacigeorgica]|uniref:TIGR03086 family metal-binding protein n=1 Tax=Nocardia cyriacigeorgica TaxID=135487 RepID=UPI000CEB4711|nr:TIGR03086 family metal-binding protein [Nocardia cyriacigeorgica]AVH21783.1 TIGR03086 family protein [Nocardia cyriacigeorgica]MBF6321280.1 TIGR03086 family protein [Nocardia cyriacigeorgica]MBF6495024.1 TIGR03086 family protein [Nocardia cyriacigeorgica]